MYQTTIKNKIVSSGIGLHSGKLVELVPGSALDVPLYWQHARAATALLGGLSRAVTQAAARALVD